MFDERSPIYQQIAEQIKGQIVSGDLRPDEQVMSTNQYASFYRTNPATAAKGFHQLVDEVVVYKKRGIGMFVSPDAYAKLHAERRDRFFADLVDPMIAEAAAIGIPLDDVMAQIQHRKEGEPE